MSAVTADLRQFDVAAEVALAQALPSELLELEPFGGEHHQLLDSYGDATADSTFATQLGRITGEITQHKDQAGRSGAAGIRPQAAALSAGACGWTRLRPRRLAS